VAMLDAGPRGAGADVETDDAVGLGGLRGLVARDRAEVAGEIAEPGLVQCIEIVEIAGLDRGRQHGGGEEHSPDGFHPFASLMVIDRAAHCARCVRATRLDYRERNGRRLRTIRTAASARWNSPSSPRPADRRLRPRRPAAAAMGTRGCGCAPAACAPPEAQR